MLLYFHSVRPPGHRRGRPPNLQPLKPMYNRSPQGNSSYYVRIAEIKYTEYDQDLILNGCGNQTHFRCFSSYCSCPKVRLTSTESSEYVSTLSQDSITFNSLDNVWKLPIGSENCCEFWWTLSEIYTKQLIQSNVCRCNDFSTSSISKTSRRNQEVIMSTKRGNQITDILSSSIQVHVQPRKDKVKISKSNGNNTPYDVEVIQAPETTIIPYLDTAYRSTTLTAVQVQHLMTCIIMYSAMNVSVINICIQLCTLNQVNVDNDRYNYKLPIVNVIENLYDVQNSCKPKVKHHSDYQIFLFELLRFQLKTLILIVSFCINSRFNHTAFYKSIFECNFEPTVSPYQCKPVYAEQSSLAVDHAASTNRECIFCNPRLHFGPFISHCHKSLHYCSCHSQTTQASPSNCTCSCRASCGRGSLTDHSVACPIRANTNFPPKTDAIIENNNMYKNQQFSLYENQANEPFRHISLDFVSNTKHFDFMFDDRVPDKKSINKESSLTSAGKCIPNIKYQWQDILAQSTINNCFVMTSTVGSDTVIQNHASEEAQPVEPQAISCPVDVEDLPDEEFSDSLDFLPSQTPERGLSQTITSEPAPTSTPERSTVPKRRTRSELMDRHNKSFLSPGLPSSLPSRLTMGVSLSPQEKILKRCRNLSDQSDASCNSGQSITKNKKRVTQKRIDSDGSFYLDKNESCKAHYLESFLGEERTESLLSECSNLITRSDVKKTKLEFRRDSDSGKILSDDVISNDLTKLITHECESVEKATRSLFKLDIKFDNIVLHRLMNEKHHIPYQSYNSPVDNDNEDKVVGILTVGAPRTLSLKTISGRKVTHLVPHHSGSLSIMSGMTQSKYEHSILKPKYCSSESLCMVFIGSLHSDGSSSDPTSRLAISDSTGTETSASASECESEDNTDFDNEVINISLLGDLKIPTIDVTSPTSAGSTDTKLYDNIKQKNNFNHHQCKDRSAKEDTEDVVLPPSSSSFTSNIQPGSISLSQSKLEHDLEKTVIHCKNGNSSQPETDLKLACLEQAVIANTKQLARLSEAFVKLRDHLVSEHEPKLKPDEPNNNSAHSEELNQLLEGNLSVISKMQEQMTNIKNEITQSSRQAQDVEETVLLTKRELEKWHNSAFYREDSQLIKDIHDCIADGRLAVRVTESSPARPNIPLSEELAQASSSETPEHVNTRSQPTQTEVIDARATQVQPPPTLLTNPLQQQYRRAQSPSPSSRPPPLIPISPTRPRTVDPPEQIESTLYSYVVGHSSQSPPKAIKDDPSRRPTFINRTEAGPWIAIPRTGNSTAPTTLLVRNSNTTATGSSVQNNQGPNAHVPQKKIFKTILVTDSIMRHIPSDALGMNHELYVLNYTGASGLAERRVRGSLEKMQPDFVYIHLGINDIFRKTDVKEITSKLAEFALFASDNLKESKVVFSLPLTTNKELECEQVRHLHALTMGWIVKGNSPDTPVDDRQCHFMTNQNMRTIDWTQKKIFFAHDGIHLTSAGKDAILKNFRYRIHSMARTALEKLRLQTAA